MYILLAIGTTFVAFIGAMIWIAEHSEIVDD